MNQYEELGSGVLKRRERRELGLFIDGTGLDRATRRLKRKVDLPRLVRGVASGTTPIVARYYTLIPYEDDSRQRAFLDAVRRAGLRVIVKRLPPKGVNRQVGIDVQMSADIIAFALGHSSFSSLNEYISENEPKEKSPREEKPSTQAEAQSTTPAGRSVQRIVTVVCPSRDISYPLAMASELGADTVSADFGQFNTKDVLKSAAKWIDLSDSETIWRDE